MPVEFESYKQSISRLTKMQQGKVLPSNTLLSNNWRFCIGWNCPLYLPICSPWIKMHRKKIHLYVANREMQKVETNYAAVSLCSFPSVSISNLVNEMTKPWISDILCCRFRISIRPWQCIFQALGFCGVSSRLCNLWCTIRAYREIIEWVKTNVFTHMILAFIY